MQASPLRISLRSRATQVRLRVKTLLSTYRRSSRTRLGGVCLPHAFDAALTSRSGLYSRRAVGGFFKSGDLHAADRRFFCAVESLNSSQQCCEAP